MIDFTFTYADLEFFLLIVVRVTCFIFIAPFFGMNNVPRRVKVGLGIFISYFIFTLIDHNEVVYSTVTEYAIIVMKDPIFKHPTFTRLGTLFIEKNGAMKIKHVTRTTISKKNSKSA